MGIQTYCEDFGNCYDDNGNDVNCGDLPRSSSSTEKCSHISDRKEIYGDNVSFTPCMDGTRALDCKNYQDYTCIGGEWHIALVILGGVLTTKRITPALCTSHINAKTVNGANIAKTKESRRIAGLTPLWELPVTKKS